MITNATHFIGEIHLPQVGANASTQVNDNALLQSFIKKYEPKLLNKALGKKRYNEFKLQLEDDGTLKVGVDQKWDDLLNGSEYIKDGVTYFWRGLVDSSECIIAYYVYCHLLEFKISQQTTLGTKQVDSKNATATNPTPKIVKAWREFHNWYQGTTCINPVVFQYKGVYVEDYFGNDNSRNVSLFTFLSDNEYDDWSFTSIENKNSWGL